jgi:hypothetical protein
MSFLGMPRVRGGMCLCIVLVQCALVGGCMRWAPTTPVDMAIFDEAAVRRAAAEGTNEPPGMRYAHRAPASMAVARIQGEEYAKPEERHEFRVIAPNDDQEIARLLMDAGLGPSGTDLLPLARRCGTNTRYTPERLVECATGAQWLFVYSVGMERDTDYWAWPLILLTLGVAPNAVSSATAQGFGAVIDVPSGRVMERWSVVEECWQPANAWNAGTARGQSERRAERRVVAKLFKRLGATVAEVEPGKGTPARRETWGE